MQDYHSHELVMAIYLVPGIYEVAKPRKGTDKEMSQFLSLEKLDD